MKNSRSVNMEQWQMEAVSVGMKGKGHSGKALFDGGSMDFSEDYDKKLERKINKLRSKDGGSSHGRGKFRAKNNKKNNNGMKVLLKNIKALGADKTLIVIKGENRLITRADGTKPKNVDTQVIILNGFRYPNQIKRDYGQAVVKFYYEVSETGNFSEAISPNWQ